MRAEATAALLEALAQLAVIVDLAVVDELQIPVGAGHRLMPAGDVDDAEPAHAQAGDGIGVDAAVVGSAMADRVAHPPEQRFASLGRKVETDVTGDAAHGRARL